MTAIPLCGSTSRVSASGPPSLLGAAVPACRVAKIDPALYVEALEHQAALPGVGVVLIQTDSELYLSFGPSAIIVAKECPGVPLVWGESLGRRVPVAAVELDAVDDVRRSLYEAGIASARADQIDDSGRTAVTFVSRPPPPPLDGVERDRLLRQAATYLPRPVRAVVTALLDFDADSQRLAMRSIVAWLRNFDRHPLHRLPNDVRPDLPARAVLGAFAQLLSRTTIPQQFDTIPTLQRFLLETNAVPQPSHLRLSHGADEADDVAACEGVQCGA